MLVKFDGFVKSPSAALRFNFVVAAHLLVRLTPQFLRALHLELFTKPSFRRLFTRSSNFSVKIFQAKNTPLPFYCQGERKSLPAPLLISVLEAKAWTGPGDGDAIRESTGRDLSFHLRNQNGFRKGRRKVCGPAYSHGKITALWFREAWHCPRAPAGTAKYRFPLCFYRSEGGHGKGFLT